MRGITVELSKVFALILLGLVVLGGLVALFLIFMIGEQSPENEAGERPVPPGMRPYCKGVYVGKCVVPNGEIQTEAHAHVEGLFEGWVCFWNEAARYSYYLRAHELAHLMHPEDGHGPLWQAQLRSLGYHVPKMYHQQRVVQ